MWDQQSITDLCDVTSCSGLGRQQSVIWFMNFKPSCLGALDPRVVCQQQQPLPQRDIFIYFMFMFNACDLCSALLSRPWWKIPTALSSDLHPPLQQLSVSLITAFQSVLHKFILLSVSASPTTSARARVPPPSPLRHPSLYPALYPLAAVSHPGSRQHHARVCCRLLSPSVVSSDSFSLIVSRMTQGNSWREGNEKVLQEMSDVWVINTHLSRQKQTSGFYALNIYLYFLFITNVHVLYLS